MSTNTLCVGDTVLWRGGWGDKGPVKAKVECIALPDGRNADTIPWSDLSDREIIVDLDNGRWAYGFQIQPVDV